MTASNFFDVPPGPESETTSVMLPKAATHWLRTVAAKERRSLGFVIREAIDAYYREREGKEPPWV